MIIEFSQTLICVEADKRGGAVAQSVELKTSGLEVVVGSPMGLLLSTTWVGVSVM